MGNNENDRKAKEKVYRNSEISERVGEEMTPEEQAETVTLIRAVIAQEKIDEQKTKDEKDRIVMEWVFDRICSPISIITLFVILAAVIWVVLL